MTVQSVIRPTLDSSGLCTAWFFCCYSIYSWRQNTYLSAMDDTGRRLRDLGLIHGSRRRPLILVWNLLKIGFVDVVLRDPGMRMLKWKWQKFSARGLIWYEKNLHYNLKLVLFTSFIVYQTGFYFLCAFNHSLPVSLCAAAAFMLIWRPSV